MNSNSDEAFELDDFMVQVIRSSRRTTLALELGPTGITARAPNSMSLRSIKQFVNLKRHWIGKHLANRPAPPLPLKLIDGAELNLLGTLYTLAIDDGRGAVKVSQHKQISVPITQSHLPRQESVRRKLVKWYKQVALQELSAIARCQAIELFSGNPKLQNITPADVKVRDYKRRWGSCNRRGELSLNWRIIMAPRSVCEYVIVHELAHRKEFNHSRQFWQIVERQRPDWRTSRDWLTQNGRTLYRF